MICYHRLNFYPTESDFFQVIAFAQKTKLFVIIHSSQTQQAYQNVDSQMNPMARTFKENINYTTASLAARCPVTLIRLTSEMDAELHHAGGSNTTAFNR
jgi:hypothetical protein